MALRKISDDAGKGFLYTEMKMHRHARITTHTGKNAIAEDDRGYILTKLL